MSDESVRQVSIVMPAYNEEANIEATVRKCHDVLVGEGIDGEIVVADDGSGDRTGEILDGLRADIPCLVVVHLDVNSGYGTAMRAAIERASGKHVATIDSDGQFDIADMPRLLARMGDGVACVTGYRAGKKDSPLKVLADRVHSLLVRVLCGIRFRDSQCALKVYRTDALKALVLEARGYTLPTEALVKLHHGGHRVLEEAVRHLPREAGKSGISFLKTSFSMFTFLLYLRFRITMSRRKMIDSP